MKGATWHMRGFSRFVLLAFLISAGSLLWGQSRLHTYVGTELTLLRFHRNFLPPALTTGIVGGVAQEIWRSGVSHAVIAWGEGRLFYPVGISAFPLSAGVSVGTGWQISLPDPERYAFQLRLGLDGYTFQTDGRQGIPLRDQQLRPLLQFELTVSFPEAFFVRYGFYPTPGSTSKYYVAVGSYF